MRNWRFLARPMVGRVAFRLRSASIFALTLGSSRTGTQLVEPPNRLLVVKLDEIGDAVLATPFLRELRRAVPNAWVVLVTSPAAYPIMELCPYADRVLTFRRNRGRLALVTGPLAALRFGRATLRQGFDVAVLPRWYIDEHDAVFLAYASDAARRIGYSEKVTAGKALRNRGYDRLLTDAVVDRAPLHEVERNLALLSRIDGTREDSDASLELWVNDSDRAAASDLLRASGVAPTEPLVALSVGAGHPKRWWPADRFATIGAWLREDYGMRALVLGGTADREVAARVATEVGPDALSLAGATTLRQSAALLEHCGLFVGNDSGLMHLAAAAGVPVVEVSCHAVAADLAHANSPIRFGPWGVPSSVLQPPSPSAPCREGCEAEGPHCILQVDAGQVRRAVARLLAEREQRSRPGVTLAD